MIDFRMSSYFLTNELTDTTIDNPSPPLSSTKIPDETLSSLDISDQALLQLAEEYCDSMVARKHPLSSQLDLIANRLEQLELIANKLEHRELTEINQSVQKLWITAVNQAIQELWNEIYTLRDFTKPQTITIHNFHCLKVNTAVTSIKDKVNSLFFDALIPITWKTSVTWSENLPKNEVENVTITFINFHVKEKVFQKLKKYFEKQYNNTVYI